MDFASFSVRGGREINEDAIEIVFSHNGLCALVADGLGGQGHGDIASKNAVKCISEAFLKNPSADEQIINKYFDKANKEALERNRGKENTLTTVVGLFYVLGKATIAHVGDSRLYHFNNGKIVSRTTDHSVAQLAVKLGEISEDEIRNHPDRGRILRAIGLKDSCQVEINSEYLSSGFNAFLLCSDGFWEYVLENEMEIDLAKSDTAFDWMEHLKQRIRAKAPDDCDNCSAIMIFI